MACTGRCTVKRVYEYKELRVKKTGLKVKPKEFLCPALSEEGKQQFAEQALKKTLDKLGKGSRKKCKAGCVCVAIEQKPRWTKWQKVRYRVQHTVVTKHPKTGKKKCIYIFTGTVLIRAHDVEGLCMPKTIRMKKKGKSLDYI